MRAVAAKADRVWACQAKQLDGMVAMVDTEREEDDNIVAAGGGKNHQKSGWEKAQWKKGHKSDRQQQQHQKYGGGQQQCQEKNSPMDLAIAASGLCRAHWFNREKARHCTQGKTCSWQEN